MVCATAVRHEFDAHRDGDTAPAEPVLIAEPVDIRNKEAVIDGHHRHKQPDWTCRATSSGSTPVDLKRLYGRTPTQFHGCDRVDRSRYIAGSGSTNHSKGNIMNVLVVGVSGAVGTREDLSC